MKSLGSATEARVNSNDVLKAIASLHPTLMKRKDRGRDLTFQMIISPLVTLLQDYIIVMLMKT